MRLLSALGAGLLVAATPVLGSQAEQSIQLRDLAGVWKRAYEPGLAGVSEPDDGYLVLYPDGSYVEAGSLTGDERSAFARGSFTYAAGVLRLHRTGAQLSDGTDPGHEEGSSTWRLHLQPRSTIVFFDRTECLVETLVLTAGRDPRDLNYSWALALGGGVDHRPVPRFWEPCVPSRTKRGGAEQ